ncbi:hypothetical protein SNEBB_008158 [Seison nebaliae]|nr:hypothetical protein SNEBB_008158 [Seison nebaliae]
MKKVKIVDNVRSAITIAEDDIPVILRLYRTEEEIKENISQIRNLEDFHYFISRKIPGMLDRQIVVHSADTDQLTFGNTKNFRYEKMKFHQFLELLRISEEQSINGRKSKEFHYLRSVSDETKERADFRKDWKELSQFINIDHLNCWENWVNGETFSTVLRLSSPYTKLWCHYDVMDNCLLQICGEKRMTLFPPSDLPYLYLDGDKPTVEEIDNLELDESHQIYKKFENFHKNSHRYIADIERGDILFIPSLWFHHAANDGKFSLAINNFWKRKETDIIYNSLDVYGNKDPLSYERAERHYRKHVKSELNRLPEKHRKFYVQKLLNEISKDFSISP